MQKFLNSRSDRREWPGGVAGLSCWRRSKPQLQPWHMMADEHLQEESDELFYSLEDLLVEGGRTLSIPMSGDWCFVGAMLTNPLDAPIDPLK